MSGINPIPPPVAPPVATPPETAPNTGEVIAQDLKTADSVIVPFISIFDPAIGKGLDWGLKLLAIAEPTAYNAVVTALQGSALSPEQLAELTAAEQRLQNPENYFA